MGRFAPGPVRQIAIEVFCEQGQPEQRRTRVTCLTGKSKRAACEAPSSPFAKNIPFLDSPKSVLELIPSCSVRGALAIVTDVERDAVDADAPITNGV